MQHGFNTIVTLNPSQAGKLMQYPPQEKSEPKFFVPVQRVRQQKFKKWILKVKHSLKTYGCHLLKNA